MPSVTLVLLPVTIRGHAGLAASVYTFRVAGEVCSGNNAPLFGNLSGIRVIRWKTLSLGHFGAMPPMKPVLRVCELR